MPTTCYLYERWSTPAQTEGDSARRQLAAAERYVEQHPGLVLDRKSRWRDAGVSAFRGDGQAALQAFVAAVQAKRITKGSYLLIENLDRLSRAAPLPALNSLQRLLSLGVYVVTLTDGKRYDAGSLASEDVTDLLTALLHAHRAHSESAVKSRRVREALKAKRARAAEHQTPLGSICPSWLTLEGGRYVVDKGKARTVRTIFDLTASGLGNTAVAKRLNRSHVRPISGRAAAWSAGSVGQLVTNRAVLGEYAPHTTKIDAETGKRTRVPDGDPVMLYPPVIPVALFMKCQRDRQKRRNPPGPRGEMVSNLFTGLLRCSCGASVHLLSHRPGAKYLTCSGRISGSKCRMTAWPLLASPRSAGFEAMLLALCSRIIPWGRLLPQTRSAAQEQLAALIEQDAALEVERLALDAKVAKVIEAVEQVGVSPSLAARLTALELQAVSLKRSAEDVRGRVVEARAILASARETVEGHQKALAAWQQGKMRSEEDRSRLAATLRGLVKVIQLRPDRRLGITLATGEGYDFICSDDLLTVADTDGAILVELRNE
jgi:DNA invertase Pin-like site-specific DNA recombinase